MQNAILCENCKKWQRGGEFFDFATTFEWEKKKIFKSYKKIFSVVYLILISKKL